MKAKAKTSRVSDRVTPSVYSTLTEASKISGATLNQFLVQAALEKAYAIIEYENKLKLNRESADHQVILGFYTLSICEIETDYLPGEIAKKYPNQIPAVKLASLAVSMKHQHKGYGNYLIGSAVEKVILISNNVGIIGLFVDAKDNHAKGYYAQFGFISLQGNPLILFLPMHTLNKYNKSKH